MYATTGLHRHEFIELIDVINEHVLTTGEELKFPPSLGFLGALKICITYLRRNTRQVELADYYRTSQATVSRAISNLTPVLERTLRDYVPVAEDLPADEDFIIDGTLVPCCSWADQPDLYSGKHKTTGHNLQVVCDLYGRLRYVCDLYGRLRYVCDLYGRLRYVSDPLPGSRHDLYALEQTGILQGLDPARWMGDKGYIGNDMITPLRKPPNEEMLDHIKNWNTSVNKIRYMIERAIAN